MAKKRGPCCEDGPAEVPVWFMTYSDVITLLMTFFILLLTFATNEPEHFSRMQVAAFGGGSSSGIAGKNEEPFDSDAILLRIRPSSARLTTRGSEMPPSETDPSYQSLDLGVESLKNPHELADADRLSITIPLPVMIDADRKVTGVGHQQLRMISSQMRRMTLDVKLEVRLPQDADACLALANALIKRGNIAPGRVSVATDVTSIANGMLRLSLIRSKAGS